VGGGAEVGLHSFFAPALDGVEWLTLPHDRCNPEKSNAAPTEKEAVWTPQGGPHVLVKSENDFVLT